MVDSHRASPPACKIAPSILASDFARLADEAANMKVCGADWLHVDCMDGHFVPNLTIGPPVVAALRQHTDLFLDVHLMVTDPGAWVDELARGGADCVTFHVESFCEAGYDKDADAPYPDPCESEVAACVALARKIRGHGMRAGLAVRPRTPLSAVRKVIDAGVVDMLLAMTVEPGFGGQKFTESVMEKVAMARAEYQSLDIEVDGGLSPSTIDKAASAGANVIVAGSAVFGAKKPKDVIGMLRGSVQRSQAVLTQ